MKIASLHQHSPAWLQSTKGDLDAGPCRAKVYVEGLLLRGDVWGMSVTFDQPIHEWIGWISQKKLVYCDAVDFSWALREKDKMGCQWTTSTSHVLVVHWHATAVAAKRFWNGEICWISFVAHDPNIISAKFRKDWKTFVVGETFWRTLTTFNMAAKFWCLDEK